MRIMAYCAKERYFKAPGLGINDLAQRKSGAFGNPHLKENIKGRKRTLSS